MVARGIPGCSIHDRQNVVGTPHVTPFREQSVNDRIARVVIFVLLFLPWGIVPVVGCIVCFGKYRRPWVFNRLRMQLTRSEQNWPLKDLSGIAVDLRRNHGSGFAAVILYFHEAGELEIARFSGGSKTSLSSRIALATDLAIAVGEFLSVQVRLPALPHRAPEVVMPKRS